MTPENAAAFRMGAHVPAGTAVSVGVVPNCVSPCVNAGNPPELSRPLKDADYNSRPLADTLYLQCLRSSDPLHRSDMLASVHKRATALNVYLKEKGPDAFKSHYKL